MATLAGVLGSRDLNPNINQAIYYNNDDAASSVTISVCNRGNTVTYVSVAVSTSATLPADAEWIRFNNPVSPKGVLEKQGIVLSPGMYLVVRSTNENVNAVAYGLRVGNVINSVGISTNLGIAPTWETSPTLTFYSADSTSIQLAATDAQDQPITYAVSSGSLPSGVNLASSGLITGTPSPTGYVSGISDAVTTAVITATNESSLSTPQTFNIVRSWADGTSSGRAIPASASVTAVTNYTAQTTGDIWVKDRSGNTVQTKLFKPSTTAYILISGISDDTTHGQYASVQPTGSWFGKWTSAETFGNYATANQIGGFKSSLYHDYNYDDILVMQGFSNGSISTDYYANSNEVAYTSNGWLNRPGLRNLKNFFSGPQGPNLRVNGSGGRTKVPVTFLKGNATTVRGRYKSSAQGELSATNVFDFGNQNAEGYRYAMCNALGCEQTGTNIEHTAWTADVANNYSMRNYSEPNWDTVWGITGVTWMYWLFWAKS